MLAGRPNAGGAVGFPFSPVDDEQVRPALEAMLAALHPATNHLLLATVQESLAGWLLLSLDPDPLTRHWVQVLRVQTALGHRGRGVGRALMDEVARSARDDLGLEQLHLQLRPAWAWRRSTAGSAGTRSGAGQALCACPSTTSATRCSCSSTLTLPAAE